MNCNINKYNFNDEINQKLLKICPKGVELYLVGGYIRDILLNKKCIDRDYVVKGHSAIDFAEKVSEVFDGHFIVLDKEHDIARVVMPDKINTLDFAGCVGVDIYSDLKNRDFVINSVACKLKVGSCEVIDPLGGIKEIENKVIRTVCEQNIIDDPLRILRAFRFSAQFGFDIEEKTLEWITKHNKLIANIAFERINTELIKLLEGDNAADALALMKETEFLFEIFPELLPQKDVPPNLHHHLCLIDHSIESVKQIEIELNNLPDWAKEHIDRQFSTTVKAISLLKLATLLHDLGKPSTWTIEEDGRHRFIKHEEVGSILVVDLLKRLKLSKNAINYIVLLIKSHLYPSQLIREGIENMTDKALMRFFRRITDSTPELLLLGIADRLSTRGTEISEEAINTNISGIKTILDRYKAASEDVKTIPKLVSGKDVIELLNIAKGPQVGTVLKELKEAQISGDINTKDEALDFIKNFDLC